MVEERAEDFLDFTRRAAPNLHELFDGEEWQHEDNDDTSSRAEEEDVNLVNVLTFFKSKQLTKKALQLALERPPAIVCQGCPVANDCHLRQAAS